MLANAVRSRFHPLHHLRKSATFRRSASRLNVPIWARVYGVDWKVRVRAMQHASFVLVRRTPEPEIVALFIALSRLLEPRVFWDVGANFGYYTWLLKSRDPHLAATLFEPDLSNIELIRGTVRRSGLSLIDVQAVAVSACDGEASFALDEVSGATGTLEDPEGSFSVRHWHVRPPVVSVRTVSLDSHRLLQRPDLIKVDVEGHEEHVFRGARATLEIDRPVVVFECFRRHSPVFDQFRDLGFELYDAERPDGPLDEATNFLALPSERSDRAAELFALWRQECG